jgi:hypothetical protein
MTLSKLFKAIVVVPLQEVINNIYRLLLNRRAGQLMLTNTDDKLRSVQSLFSKVLSNPHSKINLIP